MRLLTTALVAGMVGAGLVAGSGPASAAPLCEVRSSAHIAEHGGLMADSAYHVAHGDLPTCDTSDSARQGDKPREDNKSRFCRKRWYC
ncbi:hypothetical protein PBI_VANISOA_82 [Mycobacterium phage Vanisoa]|nr:hypothetical protein PBI_VANISOA_82 [Mycobacterium phage Vanisoa]